MTSPTELPRISFFDDDDLNIRYEFQKPEKNQIFKELTSSPPTLIDQLFRKIISNSTGQQGYYGLIKRFIVYYKVYLYLYYISYKSQFLK